MSEEIIRPRLPIAVPYAFRDQLSLKEVGLLVKAISINGNCWVEGYYTKMKTGFYDVHGKFQEKYISIVFTAVSSGGFTWAEVYPETVCKCTSLLSSDGTPLYEHDYLDEHHYNEVECFIGDSFNVNGDTPLKMWISDNRPFQIYGNAYDHIIYENQEKERIEV